jgi:hypothetical protein
LLLQLVAHGPHRLLDCFADLLAQAAIRLIHGATGFPQVVKLAALVRDLGPEGRDRLAKRLLRVTDGSQHGQVQGHDRRQEPFDRLGVTHPHVLGGEHAAGEHVAHEVDGFVAVVGLNAIDRDDQATVGAHLRLPGGVRRDLVGGAHHGAVGIEELRDFTARDTLCEGREPGLEHLMGFGKGVVLGEAEMTNQHNDIEPAGKAG